MENCKLTLVENPPIVMINDLSKNFDQIQALKQINLTIPEGKIIGLLGPNGGGKTTLLKILAGLYRKYQGDVEIEGSKPGAASKSVVSYLPDRIAFSLNKSAKDVLWIYENFFDDFDKTKFMSLMDRFECSFDRPFREMSKGMVDKIQICFAMSRNAKLFLLDEPLGGVDVVAREKVLDAIIENFDVRGTIIVATHLISEVERLFDSAIVLKEGEIILNESCEGIKARYGATLNDSMKEIFRAQ